MTLTSFSEPYFVAAFPVKVGYRCSLRNFLGSGVSFGDSFHCACSYGAFTHFRWNALRQRMAEEESGAWGSVHTKDVIVRLTGKQTNHATSKLLTL